jgi:hypothetical protein
VLVGGDIKKSGNVRGDGIVRVFVGGDVHGPFRTSEARRSGSRGISMARWRPGHLRRTSM